MNTEKMVFTASLSIHVILQLVIIILFGVTYMYIHKMEQAGCECAMHPYRNFIKYFPIFAVLYLLLTMMNPVIIMKQPSMAPVEHEAREPRGTHRGVARHPHSPKERAQHPQALHPPRRQVS